MLMQDLTSIDAARVASLTNYTAETFNYLGGWSVIGPILFAILLFQVMYYGVPGFSWALLRFITLAPLRERWAMNRKQDREERELLADYVTDALEAAYNKQQITFETKQRLYQRIGKLGYPDLLSRGAATLKEEIQKRRADPKVYPRNPDGSVMATRFPGHADEVLDTVVVVLI